MPRPGVHGAETATSVSGAAPVGAGHGSAPAPGRVAPTSGSAVGSFVIPAHDEAAVIGRGLDRLLTSLGAGIEVVVVCNGCTDGTADVARQAGARVSVVELGAASKVEALRAGDRVATAFPRAYVDADVLVQGATVEAVFRRLGNGGALAARPPLVFYTFASSWFVRRFYRARSGLPAVMRSLWGAGMYALSAEGRARFDAFPAVVADDLFVDGLFRPDEVEVVRAQPVVVMAPTTAAGLLASLRRVYRGNRAAVRPVAAVDRPGTRDTVRDLVRLARRGKGELVDAVVYASAVLAARALSWRHGRSEGHWERDESSRR